MRFELVKNDNRLNEIQIMHQQGRSLPHYDLHISIYSASIKYRINSLKMNAIILRKKARTRRFLFLY